MPNLDEIWVLLKDGSFAVYSSLSNPMKTVREVASEGELCTNVINIWDTLVGVTTSGMIIMIDGQGRQYFQAQAHTSPVTCLFYLAGKNLIFTGGSDGFIKIWKVVQNLKDKHIPFSISLLAAKCIDSTIVKIAANSGEGVDPSSIYLGLGSLANTFIIYKVSASDYSFGIFLQLTRKSG